MKARGNGKAALWAQFRKDLPLAKSLLRDTAIGMPAWDLDKWKEIVGRTDKSKAGMLATQIEWWQHSIGVTCISIDADRKALENTTDRIEGQAPDIIELGDKKIRNCAWQYMGTQKQYLTIGQTVSRYGGAILDKVFKSIPLMVCGENGTTPQILDLHRFANNALPIKCGGWELPEGGNLSASVIRVAIIGNALAALVRLLEVCKRTHPKCAASVEELEIDIENFNGELFNGYSLALLDIRKKLLADFRRVRVALADILDAQTGADARQADGTAGALPVVRLDEDSKRGIAQANAKLDRIIGNRLATLEAQREAGKKGAKAAIEARGIDSQRAEIYKAAKKQIDKGEKTAAAFAAIAARFGTTPDNAKSIYYRERKKRAGETRGKYNRKGKKRGRYSTIGHAKR